jgi:hypothetical protein
MINPDEKEIIMPRFSWFIISGIIAILLSRCSSHPADSGGSNNSYSGIPGSIRVLGLSCLQNESKQDMKGLMNSKVLARGSLPDITNRRSRARYENIPPRYQGHKE